jgi:ABC-2 type transport system permease protein
MRGLAVETWVVFLRQMRGLLRNPVWVFFGLTQPILYLVLFGPLLKQIPTGGLGGDAAWSVFVPGLLLQLGLFGAGFAGFGIIQELREGVVDRQRVTPALRLSLILGRCVSNVVTIGVQATLLTLVALPFGLSAPFAGVVLSVLLVSVLALGLSAASYAMGLILRDEDSFAPFVQGVMLPLLLLSGVLLPMSLAPTWLRRTSEINPLTHMVDGMRALFAGHYGDNDVWVGALLAAVVVTLLTFWGARTFQRQNA